jgi:hypothetical protein
MNALGILFFQQADFGWSEVYPLIVSDYAGAATKLAQINTDRLAMLLSDVTLIGSRISDTDVKGDSYPTGLTVPTHGTYTAVAGEETFQPTYALRVALFAGTLKRGSRFVRCVPSGAITMQGFYTPEAAWDTALDTWLAYLIGNVSIATRIKGAVAPPFFTFTAITATAIRDMEKRACGRPFGLSRGRRVIA